MQNPASQFAFWEPVAGTSPSSMRHIAWVECKRLGWSWPEAFVLQDDLGFRLVPTQVSPGCLRKATAEARRRKLRLQIGLGLGGEVSLPVSEELVANALRTKKHTGRDKACITEWLCDNVWTDSRLAAAG